MDSLAVNRLFRQLASHRFCTTRYQQNLLRSTAPIAARRTPTTKSRSQSSGPRRGTPSSRTVKSSVESDWQQRTDYFPADRTDEFNRYPIVTSDALRTRKERPRRTRLLMRDFIEDSLYNPHYGYFSKNATIFTPGDAFRFHEIKDEPEFQRLHDLRYQEFEDKLDEKEGGEFNRTRQLWHTPTELFSPYYGEAIARYMVANYKLSLYPYHDLVIYEMGAGNGTLMMNILDYIRDADPDVYERTKFRIIEVSSALATMQGNQLIRNADSSGHSDKVEIINKSIFDWDTFVPTPCFFLAMEVFDNFAHDVIRYDPYTEQPLQGQVLIDAKGDFFEFYTAELDPVVARYLRVRDVACQERSFSHPLRSTPRFMRKIRHGLPFAPNLTLPEYVPTRQMHFFDVLSSYFPAHRLIMSDFHSLPKAVPGYNAPVVQTRYDRRTIPVSTPLVQQGFFDIFFPTDFGVMEDIYRAITGRLTKVMSHEDWLVRWADIEACEMQSGENALLGWYKNASVMVTV
ncbi:DUF185-domain-containing protein [Polychaeton citri CBS 116435]|uniref:Protein arginine methyltransferase NDUFAF7 n=1 Tax=Polychaeton citri CBS 116435 TaxID=1314669 RepID=A0A9P4Q3I1_9PEZI|nr:DUF185-domain-containing protein [Polychaeton citri CBS 116435]